MSTNTEPIFSSMRKEVTNVGVEAFLFAVGLATVDTVLPSSYYADILKWGLLLVATFKICSIYRIPKMKKNEFDAIIHDYPLAQTLVDLFMWIIVSIIGSLISQVEKNLTEEERKSYGVMTGAGVLFCNYLCLLIIIRGCFLFVDSVFGNGKMSRAFRSLVSREVEGLPVGIQNVHHQHTD